MKQFTKENFSTAFQLIIISLLFIYAAFPKINEEIKTPVTNTLSINKNKNADKEVNHYYQNWFYFSNTSHQLWSNKNLSRLKQHTNLMMYTVSDNIDYKSRNTTIINSK